jgi:hypothetical protein
MPDRKPTPAQAQLHLQVYDLRREARLREARDWMMQNFFVDNLDDYARICPPGSKEGTWAMMVVSYWDQACALLNYGLLHESLFFETNGEFFAVWDRIKPLVGPMRERYHINFWASNLEKAAGRFEKWVEKKSPGALAAMREFTTRIRAAKAQKDAAAKPSSAN